MLKVALGFVVGTLFALLMLFALFVMAPLMALFALSPASPPPPAVPTGAYAFQRVRTYRGSDPSLFTVPPPSPPAGSLVAP